MKLKMFMLAHLFLIVACTAAVAQESHEFVITSRSQQEVFNARTHDRITRIESQLAQNSSQLESFSKDMSALRSSVDQFIGFSKGAGALLVVLQGIQMILIRRKS